jgi:hypothetical protein
MITVSPEAALRIRFDPGIYSERASKEDLAFRALIVEERLAILNKYVRD